MSSTAMDDILQLPPDIRLEYLAEGGANIAYRIDSASQPHFRKYLLRLHKTVPWIPSYAALHATQERLVNPLFAPAQLVSQTLVAIPPGIIHNCNVELRAGESTGQAIDQPRQSSPTHFRRPLKRHGLYLSESELYGFLVTDMTATPPGVSLALEFKPKWLLQSPNAPPGSTRCRTCALHAMRLHDSSFKTLTPAQSEVQAHQQATPLQNGQQKRQKPTTHFCPLDLLSKDSHTISHLVATILNHQPHQHPSSAQPTLSPAQHSRLAEALTHYLLTSPLLPHLLALQASLDPSGILSLPPDATPSVDFLIATTLRDCTLFFKVGAADGLPNGKMVEARDESSMVEARLGDLDVKAPERHKVRQWRETEERLVVEGWYFGGGSECVAGRNGGAE